MTTFAEGRERNLALGIYGAASGSGAAAGVLLGGVLTSYLELVVDLLHQRAGRHRRDRADAAAAAREPRRPRASPLRRRRRRHGHGRADAARLRDDACDDRRLGLATRSGCSAASAALIARLRRDRASLEGAAAAAADLPAADARRGERDDGDRRRRRVLRVLRADAVPAGRPALLGRAERRRVRRASR